jgi:hypothetical protein
MKKSWDQTPIRTDPIDVEMKLWDALVSVGICGIAQNGRGWCQYRHPGIPDCRSRQMMMKKPPRHAPIKAPAMISMQSIKIT